MEAENIILYSTNCPQCMVLKQKLSAKNIPFTECNDLAEMMRLGFQSAPQLEVDGTIMNFTGAINWVNAQ